MTFYRFTINKSTMSGIGKQNRLCFVPGGFVLLFANTGSDDALLIIE